MSEFVHQPVMGREVVELLAPVPPGLIVDATVGGGGHARLVLEARDDVRVLGIDRDPDAVKAARDALAGFRPRARVVRGGFEALAGIVSTEREGNIVGILFDLGVSSPQLDRSERGFSYWSDAPLDMRMDSAQQLTAAEVVNTYAEDDLAAVIAGNGEERFARRIARAIVAARPLRTTGELVDAIRAGIPAPGGARVAAPDVPGHPHGGQPRAAEPRRRPRRVGAPAHAGRAHPRRRVPLARGPSGEATLRDLGRP